MRGVHSPIVRGVHSKLSTGGRIGGSAFTRGECIYQCTPLTVVLIALPSPCPHDSGPIQWASGDVGLKPSAAARPDGLG